MKEEWREIENFEGYYEISNLGRCRSKDRYVKRANDKRIAKGKIIKPTRCTNGYLEYQLHKEGNIKLVLAHRLVAKAFIPNPKNKPEVNHLDEVITNNRVDNLQWCTSKENSNYGSRNEKCKACTQKQWKPIKQFDLQGNFIKEYKTIGEASRAINGDISAIIRACKGKQKTSYNYIWEYSNQ